MKGNANKLSSFAIMKKKDKRKKEEGEKGRKLKRRVGERSQSQGKKRALAFSGAAPSPNKATLC